MKELAVLVMAILVAYLLAAALPALTDLSPERMQAERRLDAFIHIENSRSSESVRDSISHSGFPCN